MIRDMPYATAEQVLRLREAAIKAEMERDALAAHVERLVADGIAFMRADCMGDEEDCETMQSNFNDTILATPETSLAQRDAQLAIEAGRMTLVSLADEMDADPFPRPLSSLDLRTIARGYPSPDEVRKNMGGGQ